MGEETETENKGGETGEGGSEDKQNTPAEGSKRWNEVYRESKDAERRDLASQAALVKNNEILVKNNEEMEILKQQNADLMSSLENIEKRVNKQAVRPDPIDDPEAYDEYIINQLEQKARANQRAKKSVKPKPASKPTENSAASAEDISRLVQIERQKELHPDYLDIIGKVQEEMAGDLNLQQQILKSKNPAKIAYDYGAKKYGNKDDNTDQAYSEDGGGYSSSSSGGDNKLSDAESRAIKGFGITVEGYKKQQAAIHAKNNKGDKK